MAVASTLKTVSARQWIWDAIAADGELWMLVVTIMQLAAVLRDKGVDAGPSNAYIFTDTLCLRCRRWKKGCHPLHALSSGKLFGMPALTF